MWASCCAVDPVCNTDAKSRCPRKPTPIFPIKARTSASEYSGHGHLNSLFLICGGCSKILNQPSLAASYPAILHTQA